MATYYVKRALEIFREGGPVALIRKSKDFLLYNLIFYIYCPFIYRIKYGEVRPRPREVLFINPKQIQYGCGSRKYPDNAPPYGIIAGDWDLKKSYWRNRVFYSLYERYKDGKQWKDTEYYNEGIEHLESGGQLNTLDGPQTISYFENYLDELDELYEDIESNGYDTNYLITVSIGRNGEWMVNHGNHRHAILQVVNVDQVPVKIKYRHKQWQDLRIYISNNGFPEGCEDLREHPDLQNVIG